MNKERLEKVIEAVRNAPPERFDMNCWQGLPFTECNTSACAIGHFCWANPDAELKLIGRSPRFDGNIGWAAVIAYFDLEHVEATYLFDADSYFGSKPDRERVINRIRNFIDSGGKCEAVTA